MNLSMFEEFFNIGDLGDLLDSYWGDSGTVTSFFNVTSLAYDTYLAYGKLFFNSVGFAITFLGEFLFYKSSSLFFKSACNLV